MGTGRIPEWSLGDRVRKAREWAELDQVQLAEATGISRTTISNYERDATAASRANLNLIALATGVDIRWLRGEPFGGGEELPGLDSNQEPIDFQSALAKRRTQRKAA